MNLRSQNHDSGRMKSMDLSEIQEMDDEADQISSRNMSENVVLNEGNVRKTMTLKDKAEVQKPLSRSSTVLAKVAVKKEIIDRESNQESEIGFVKNS